MYSKLRTNTRYWKKYNKQNWGAVLLDEGHEIKNGKAQQTKMCMELQRKYSFIITGMNINQYFL
jgi:SNF2 family DNA or RNA helicase